TRRYETASAFAADVRRFLAEEPVEARPPSAVDRLRKFVRRNRAAVFLTSFVAASVVAVLFNALVGQYHIRPQRDRALRAEARARAELHEKERARAEAVAARRKAEEFAGRLREATALVGRAAALTQEHRWSAAHDALARAEAMQPGLLEIY